MKLKRRSQQWIPSTLVVLALASGTSLCLAADISYTFDTDVQGWSAADGHGSVAWDATHGRGEGGCLKYTLVAGVDGEVDPRVDVAFDTTGYFSVEFDMMVDASSGTDTGGSYGNLQLVARDASWSWDSMWFGSVGASFNSYQHVKKAFTSAYGAKAHLQFQLQGAAPYSGNVIIYIDNVVIRDGTPPNQAVLFDFAWPEEVTLGFSQWAGGTPAASGITVSQDTTLTNGALRFTVDYNPSNSGWQEGDVQMATFDWDPSKFTWLEFDLYLDAPTGLSTYGIFQVFQINSSWGWQWIAGPNLSAANIGTWKHYKVPVSSMSSSHGLIIQVGGGMTNSFTYYVDNITAWKPASPPTISKMQKASGVGGVQITMDQNGNQWQRDALVTPSGSSYSWVGQTPATYSFTITNFPDAHSHPGFEAHLFFINSDTGPGSWNETYGGADWNAADLASVSLANNTNGTVDISFAWKTNLPSANPLPNAIYHPAAITNLPSAMGTWSLTFNSDASLTLSGPGGVSTNCSLPADVPANNFNPSILALQFGMFKNDGANDGHNDQQSGIFSQVRMTNNSGVVFDDNFAGSSLTANYDWRVTSSTAVLWLPAGIGWLLSWSIPDDGFIVKVAGQVTGPYSDAGVTYTFLRGATRFGAVPAASLPAGNAAFFRLVK